MAHFYGYIRGRRGDATRLGTKASGLTVTAASWQGAVLVTLGHDEETGQDVVSVSLVPWRGAGVDRVLYSGPVGGVAGEGITYHKGATS